MFFTTLKIVNKEHPFDFLQAPSVHLDFSSRKAASSHHISTED